MGQPRPCTLDNERTRLLSRGQALNSISSQRSRRGSPSEKSRFNKTTAPIRRLPEAPAGTKTVPTWPLHWYTPTADGAHHSPVEGGEGLLVHVVAGVFGAEVESLADGAAADFFGEGDPRFHEGGGHLAVHQRLEAVLGRAVVHQLQLFLGKVAGEETNGHVVGAGVELNRDGLVAQGTGMVVAGVAPNQDGLGGDGGAESDDAGSLFAFIGPTDLTFLSSAVRFIDIWPKEKKKLGTARAPRPSKLDP